MEYTNILQLNISRFGIGTVQFGIDYGINNKSGKVPYTDVVRIFEKAIESGVNFVDTSRLYGSSETVIGKAIEEIDASDRFVICTKLDISANYNEKSDREILKEVSDSLEKSLESLKVSEIPIYLLHIPKHRTFRNGIIWEHLKEKRDEGYIGHLGVSVSNGVEEAKGCLKDSDVEAIQIPFNIFDQRWLASGILDNANKRGCAVFTRSAYLQGLIIMDDKSVPAELSEVLKYKRLLRKIAEETSLDIKELALRYVFSIKGITSTVIGLDSYEQFIENISIYKKGKLDRDLLTRINEAFHDIPEDIVNPVFWKSQKKKYEKAIKGFSNRRG